MPVWLTYLLIVLVTFSVTRLVIKDTFPPLGVPRDHLINWWDPDDEWKIERMSRGLPEPQAHWGAVGRSLRYLMQCPWCMSVWVVAGVIWVFTLYVSVPLPWAVGIATRAVVGLIANNLDPDD